MKYKTLHYNWQKILIDIMFIVSGHCKMPELQISKVVDPAFYTDHDVIIYEIYETLIWIKNYLVLNGYKIQNFL